jgi:hypothetical protein
MKNVLTFDSFPIQLYQFSVPTGTNHFAIHLPKLKHGEARESSKLPHNAARLKKSTSRLAMLLSSSSTEVFLPLHVAILLKIQLCLYEKYIIIYHMPQTRIQHL